MYAESAMTFLSIFGLALYYWEEFCALLHPLMRKKNSKNSLVEMMTRLAAITLGINDIRIGYGILIISVSAAAVTFLVLRMHITYGLLVLASVSALLLPVLLLMCRLQAVRVKSSREGEILLTELLDNYKINYYNMQRAIEVTALTIKEAPGSKRLLFNLSKGLNTASNPEEMRHLLRDFEFGLGTSWSSVMVDNMFFSLVSGIRVTAAMEDLVKTVSQARKVSEYSKRENNESGLILKYLIPVCYLLTVLGATKYFGLTAKEYFKYQFFTTTGMNWFVLSLVMYMIGLLLNFFLSKTKLDL